jgi:hypothetical protein
MTEEQMLTKIIDKAVGNGFTFFGELTDNARYELIYPTVIIWSDEGAVEVVNYRFQEFIFSPDFLKAYFGEYCLFCFKHRKSEATIVPDHEHSDWKGHAHEMLDEALAGRSAIKYLFTFI